MHVMSVGAHAFDAEVLAGGLLAGLTSQGHTGTLLHMTLGERGDPSKRPEVYARQLEEEASKAAGLLGSESRWMGYPAGHLPISSEVALDLCQVIRELKPDLIVTHWRGSWHPRHVATHHNLLQALELAADESLESDWPVHRVRELYFGENCEDLDGFRPTAYVDVSEVMDIWLEALACYELFRRSISSGERMRELSEGIPYFSYYRSMARVRGLESGLTYAQAFMPARRAFGGLSECGPEGIRFAASRLIG